MFTLKTSLLALAASAGISSTQSAPPPSNLPVITLGNNNASMSTTSSASPLHPEKSTSSPFMEKLLGQKQEKPEMTKAEMLARAVEHQAHHHNHNHGDGVDWSKFTPKEITEILKVSEQRQKMDLKDLIKQMDQGKAIQNKLGTFVMCETSPDVSVQSLTLKYTLKGYVHTRHVTCEKGQMKTLQVPNSATDVTVDHNGEGERGLSMDRKPYQSTIWRSSQSRDVEVVREIFEILDRLEVARDFKGLALVSQDILKGIPKGDPNGIHMRASRASSVAREWLQDQEDLSSAQDWYNVTKAAKARARSEL